MLPEPKVNRLLMPDFGNRANYILGDEPVELSVFDETYNAVEVTDPDGKVSKYSLVGGKVVVYPEKVGFYKACCISTDARARLSNGVWRSSS